MRTLLLLLISALACFAQADYTLLSLAQYQAAAGTPSWSPTNLPRLARWYDAQSLGLTNGAAVTSWADLSVSNDALVAPAGSNPVYSNTAAMNNHGAVYFDGVDDFLWTTNPFAGQVNNSFFIVGMKVGSIPATFVQIANDIDQLRSEATDDLWYWRNVQTANVTTNIGTVPATSISLVAVFNMTISDLKATVGGGTTNISINPQNFLDDNGNMLVGRDSGTTNWLKGMIGEIICYNTNLSVSNINFLAGYLTNRWGCTWTNL